MIPVYLTSAGRAGRILMGLLIVVQGLETSRFSAPSPPDERGRTMRIAQLVSSAVDLAFVSLAVSVLGPPAA